MPSAILLIAHGSRVETANADLRQLASMVAGRCPRDIVEYAYLELAGPSIPEGFRACMERGATDVTLLPWFLSAGAHVSEDLEQYRRRFQGEFPHVRCRVSPPLGLHPLMVDLLLLRLQEAS